MQIHELNTFSGTPSSSDYLIIEMTDLKSRANAIDMNKRANKAIREYIRANKLAKE